MRKIFFPCLAVAGIFFISSCKEVIPQISGSNASATDTMYTAPVESKQPHIVLIEEFTGVSCPPCPTRGHQKLEAIEAQYPGKTAIIGMQIYNVIQTMPVEVGGVVLSKYDNRTQDGTDVASVFGGVGTGIPSAYIDRTKQNNVYPIEPDFWTNIVSNRIAMAAPVNIIITPIFNDSTKLATIKFKVSFTENVSVRQYLSVAITEDSITDYQKDGLALDTFYNHMNVLRVVLTSPIKSNTGVLGKSVNIDAGTVFERIITYTIDAAWKPKHCHIIAFVSKFEGSDKEIEQAAKAKLIP